MWWVAGWLAGWAGKRAGGFRRNMGPRNSGSAPLRRWGGPNSLPRTPLLWASRVAPPSKPHGKISFAEGLQLLTRNAAISRKEGLGGRRG